MDYLTLKSAHAALALLSIFGFIGRAIPALWFDRKWTRKRWLYWVPHLVDTLLLASGVWLAVIVGWRPGVHGWLTLKLVLLVAYIVLGWWSLRADYPAWLRVSLFVAALSVFVWIAAVAVTKSPLGPLLWIS